jgi:hypothetical protein
MPGSMSLDDLAVSAPDLVAPRVWKAHSASRRGNG